MSKLVGFCLSAVAGLAASDARAQANPTRGGVQAPVTQLTMRPDPQG
jgi:hypothetical protein